MGTIKHNLVIDTLLKSHADYAAHMSKGTPPVLAHLLNTYSDYLFHSYQSHKTQWASEFKDDFSILLGGDKLHLSASYREEHVTAWLKWILEAPPLGDKEKATFLSTFFSALLNSETYKGYPGTTPCSVLLTAPISFRTEISLDRESRIDLLIETKTTVILIENKIGDMSLEKNRRYKKLADEMWPRKVLIPILVLPLESLDKFQAAVSKEEAIKTLSAFPPATWEIVLNSLRLAIGVFEDNSPIYLLWKANVYSFISFVEGNVLGYDLWKIRNILSKKVQPDCSEISEFARYRKYRKGD